MPTTDEPARHELYNSLTSAIGERQADTLMGLLPTSDRDELVTTGYLDARLGELRSDLRLEFRDALDGVHGQIGSLTSEVGSLRSGLDRLSSEVDRHTSEIGSLRAEVGSLGAELRGEIGSLGTELRAEMASLGTDLHAELHDEIAGLRVELHQTLRSQMAWTIGTIIVIVGVLVAVHAALG